jgi:hypothetical protein
MLDKNDLQVISELLKPINDRLDAMDSRLDLMEEQLSKAEKDMEITRNAVTDLVEWRRSTLLFRLFHFSGKYPRNNR